MELLVECVICVEEMDACDTRVEYWRLRNISHGHGVGRRLVVIKMLAKCFPSSYIVLACITAHP